MPKNAKDRVEDEQQCFGRRPSTRLALERGGSVDTPKGRVGSRAEAGRKSVRNCVAMDIDGVISFRESSGTLTRPQVYILVRG